MDVYEAYRLLSRRIGEQSENTQAATILLMPIRNSYAIMRISYACSSLRAPSHWSIARVKARLTPASKQTVCVSWCSHCKIITARKKLPHGVDIMCWAVQFSLLILVTLERWTGKSIADGVAFSPVTTLELFHFGQTHSEPSRRGPRS